MPHTFSHPGYTLPLKKISPVPLSTTGLVFGSIAPDMDIIFRLSNQRTHIFNYDLYCVVVYIFPIAFFLGIYFHLVMRNILIEYLPEPYAAKYGHYCDFYFTGYLRKHLLTYILSIFISIYLHIFLDVISHYNATNFEAYGGFMYQSRIASVVFFYGSIYLPPLLLTFWGFFLILHFSGHRLKEFFTALRHLLYEREKWLFYIVLAGIAFTATVVKTLYSGIENGFAIDSIAINLTQGILVAITVTPGIFILRNKIKK